MNCKNCQNELTPESDYCNICGGKVIRNRLTLKNLFEHVSETFFNYDNKLLRTFIDLLKKPDEVINSYVKGVRKRYVNPLSFFGVSLTLSGLSLFIIQKFYLQYLDVSKFFNSEIYQNEVSQQMVQNSYDGAFEYGSLVFSFMIPFLAVISIIVFYNKHYHFTEHLIIYLYSMSELTIVSIIIGHLVLLTIPEQYLAFSLISYLVLIIYHAYVLKRVFQLTALQLLLKILFFFAIGLVIFILFTVLVAIYMIATGSINPKTN